MDSFTGGSRTATKEIARGVAPKPAVRPKDDGPRAAAAFVVFLRVVDQASQKPVSGAKWELLDSSGTATAQGETDYTGTVHAKVTDRAYTFRVLEVAKQADAAPAPTAPVSGDAAGDPAAPAPPDPAAAAGSPGGATAKADEAAPALTPSAEAPADPSAGDASAAKAIFGDADPAVPTAEKTDDAG